jgi:hypothetical protein
VQGNYGGIAMCYPANSIIALLLLAGWTFNVHAADRGINFLDLMKEQDYFQDTGNSASMQEYEKISARNRKIVIGNLKSYSESALESIGIPEEGIDFMGMALGIAFTDSKIHLNKSKTFALEIKEATDAERTLHLGIDLDW